MIWKIRITRLSNPIEIFALLMILFSEGPANRNGATTQFTIAHLSNAKMSP
jgi:hypothetical protein